MTKRFTFVLGQYLNCIIFWWPWPIFQGHSKFVFLTMLIVLVLSLYFKDDISFWFGIWLGTEVTVALFETKTPTNFVWPRLIIVNLQIHCTFLSFKFSYIYCVNKKLYDVCLWKSIDVKNRIAPGKTYFAMWPWLDRRLIVPCNSIFSPNISRETGIHKRKSCEHVSKKKKVSYKLSYLEKEGSKTKR